MKDSVFFGNGLNRISENSVSWEQLLDKIKDKNKFDNGKLPNTMVYERIFMEKHQPKHSDEADELALKNIIAEEMKSQGSNELFDLLAEMPFQHYLTTNYDYAIEKSFKVAHVENNTEKVYSLRRKRTYQTSNGTKSLWNVHGEIDKPKSIMLGLDHYCGSVGKLDDYIKGKYTHSIDGEVKPVLSMRDKLKTNSFCHTSWVDLFFSSNVHIIGFSLDYSETDIWWLLNRRARFAAEGLVKNNVYFYCNDLNSEMKGLLNSFKVTVIESSVIDGDYKSMYKKVIENMLTKSTSVEAA